jgi:deoxyribose-phosphate aldolase
MSQATSPGELAKHIDYALLKPDASLAEIEKLCAEAREHKFHSVCVNGSWVATARHCLEDSGVKVDCVVGFPLGAVTSDVKRFETEAAIDDGAHEIDVVLNLAQLKAGNDKYVFRELVDVAEAADERPVKVILETGLLTDEEKIRASRLIVESGAQFVALATGFSPGGATVVDIKLIREAVGPQFGIKAAGEIPEVETALALVAAGATRLGIVSGNQIIQRLGNQGNS